LERSNLYYTLLGPPLRPLVLEAIQSRLGRDAVRVGVHSGQDSARRWFKHLPKIDVDLVGLYSTSRSTSISGFGSLGARDGRIVGIGCQALRCDVR